jgi:S1-C subfamily serine protease
MVGNRSGVVINDEYSGDIFYIDNVLHSGASGGPVVDYKGELIGILTERAITTVPYENTPKLRVPSGAAVALTPRIMFQQLKAKDVIFTTT